MKALKPFTRIVLDEMVKDPNPISPGEQATVVGYDDIGDLMVGWDCDRTLNLIPGIDKFHVLDPSNVLEMQRSWAYLQRLQEGYEPGRCPRCGKWFDVREGVVSSQVKNIRICCGDEEMIPLQDWYMVKVWTNRNT